MAAPVKFFTRRNWKGQKRYYFHIKAANGEILCQSEAYNSLQARMKGFAALGRVFLDHADTAMPIDDDRAKYGINVKDVR